MCKPEVSGSWLISQMGKSYLGTYNQSIEHEAEGPLKSN